LYINARSGAEKCSGWHKSWHFQARATIRFAAHRLRVSASFPQLWKNLWKTSVKLHLSVEKRGFSAFYGQAKCFDARQIRCFRARWRANPLKAASV
jgi:hypothetical protein